ncbi:MAG: hypothetical protein KC766_14180 [Myxococcales bacterium]|nr:hypothetical protein [Myxococcales bacterium]
MTELDSWSKDLILAAKGADDPSEAQRARLRTSVLAATATAGIAAGSATAAATGKSAVWLKLLLGLVSLGAVSGVGYGVWKASRGAPQDDPVPALVASTAPEAPQGSTETGTLATEDPRQARDEPGPDQADANAKAEPAAPIRAPGKSSHSRLPPRGKARPGLAEEVALIARARSEVQSGNVSEAQRLLAQHRKEFPRGSLGLERSGLEIILACRAGGGKSQARAFLKRFGATPIGGSVRSACGIGE